jgi:preprotein translocase subunit SecA
MRKRQHFAQPGLQWTQYPERLKAEHAYSQLGFKAWVNRLGQIRGRSAYRRLLERQYQVTAQEISLAASALMVGDEHSYALSRATLVKEISKYGMTPEVSAQALAFVGAVAFKALGMKPFETQYVCALAMLDQRFAEMATGEGKTIAAGLAAAVAALAGAPVHMLTANDYLAERDAKELEPLYLGLGLTVASALEEHKPEERQVAYQCHIVYATAKTVAFDYLRDRLKRSQYASDLERRIDVGQTSLKSGSLMLQGLCFALIDEADSILIDEAKVPLIISDERKDASERARLWQSLDLAKRLAVDTHFIVHRAGRFIKLTEEGKSFLGLQAQQYGKAWLNRQHREELVVQALVALNIMQCDTDYLVRDKKIHIIDGITGRIAQGRIWSRGLHGLIALKENLPLPPNTETLASITFPRFFDRYHHLCGLSGTIRESSHELRANYSAAMVTVPLRKKNCRVHHAPRIFGSATDLHIALVKRVKALNDQGRPILIASDSVEHSHQIRQVLHKAGLVAEILNARHDAQEAVVIAKAGHRAAITVATQMAGRGTDIALGPQIRELGGLHVLNLQLNRSPRQDRQVRGRSARQGDPGSYDHWLSADSAAIEQRIFCRYLARWAVRVPIFSSVLLFLYQHSRESEDLKQRELVKRRDQQWAKQLSFAKIVE